MTRIIECKRPGISLEAILTNQDGEQRAEATEEKILSLLNHSDAELLDWVGDCSNEQLVELLRGLGNLVRQKDARFACMQEIGSALGKTAHLDEHLSVIMENITRLMEAERSSLFLIDQDTGELWSKVSQGNTDTEIRLKPGEGIAGWVAATGKSINVTDAYHDTRFSPVYDAETDFETESILCQPIRDQEGEIIGVVQVLNSQNGEFSVQDETLLSAIASQTAVAIENSKLYLSVVDKNFELLETKRQLEERVAELDLLVEIEQEASQVTDLEELIESLLEKTSNVMDVAVSALTLTYGDQRRLYVLKNRDGEESTFFHKPLEEGQGLPTQTDEEEGAYVCEAGGCGQELGPVSELVGERVKNLAAVPLIEEGGAIGTLEVMNRRHEDGRTEPRFDDNDVKLLTLIGGQIASNVLAQHHREEQKKARRLAAIGQMLSGVIHDLQNPIAIINGYVQLMTQADDRSKRVEYAENIERQFRHLEQMTKELLVFARGDTEVEPEWVSIGEFVSEIEELLDPEFSDRDIELEFDVRTGGRIQIDEGKLKRAVLNIARNAADAMEESETRTFRMIVDMDDSTDEVVFQFEDTGSGIPESVRENLFDTFVTQGKSTGTGLGLAIVKEIVEGHDGTIDFETTLGEGTSFEVRIPQP